MAHIKTCSLPDTALLKRYKNTGGYTDCYTREINKKIQHTEYIEAFYTTPLFKLERFLLSWIVSRPSTDQQAIELAQGKINNFAVWSVEDRSDNQLLLKDFHGRTCSWLMTVVDAEKQSTRLYFGSAVVPIIDKKTGESKMGFTFRALMGFHRLYSRSLLHLAYSRLIRKHKL